MQGGASTAPQRTQCVREERMRSDNAADGRSMDGLYGRLNWRLDRPPDGGGGEGAGTEGPLSSDRNVRRGAGRTA